MSWSSDDDWDSSSDEEPKQLVSLNFQKKVRGASSAVRKILDNTRNPQIPADVPHRYDDKFFLAEYLTNCSLATVINCFELLGLTPEQLSELRKWSETRSVTLRFEAEERCEFDRMEKKKEEGKTEHVTEVKTTFGLKAKATSKVIKHIEEHYWKFSSSYTLKVFEGNSPDEALVLDSRASEIELMTLSKDAPHPKVFKPPHLDLNMTWVLQNAKGEDGSFGFSIDRSQDSCRTPRRNEEITAAFDFSAGFRQWAHGVRQYLNSELFPKQKTELDMSALGSGVSDIFVPIVNLFEIQYSGAAASSSVADPTEAGGLIEIGRLSSQDSGSDEEIVLLSQSDVTLFLREHKRSLAEKFATLEKTFSDPGKLLNANSAKLSVLALHMGNVSHAFESAVSGIERMLWQQLVAAIGKEVTPLDFAEYMRFHNRKVFRKSVQPKPFAYAVRRPEHFPEGELSIEAVPTDGSLAQPAISVVRQVPNPHPMKFELDASSTVTFRGEHYLHAYVAQSFRMETSHNYNLVARTRQFSSFILMVGVLGGADLFQPKAAIIVKNKDEVLIPLLFEPLPTPKEFRDAIASLSPEQQAFAKAYRSMQLEGSVFSVVVVQIKPQLERLLKLPPDSLTKEIELCQDLMELFLEYQLPSDLMTFHGADDASADVRLKYVRNCVANMRVLIDGQRQEQLRKEAEERRMRELEERRRREEEMKRRELEERKRLEAEVKLRRREKEECRERRCEETMVFSSAPAKKSGGFLSGLLSSVKSSGIQMERSAAAPRRAAAPQLNQLRRAKAAAPPPRAPSPANSSSSSASACAPVKVAQEVTAASDPSPVEDTPAGVDEAGDSATSDGDGERETGQGELLSLPAAVVDYTKIPVALDQKYSALDTDNAVRPTTVKIKTGASWSKKGASSLLTAAVTTSITVAQQKKEKSSAFDLLDALTRSGALSIEAAEMHVIVAATHSFAKSIMETLVQDNINPIDKLTRTSLIIATTIHDCSASELVKPDQLDHLEKSFPDLFENKKK